jgi:hypothetical protein
VALAAGALLGCQDEFPLGSWASQPPATGAAGAGTGSAGADPGTAGGPFASAGMGGMAPRPLTSPSCADTGTPGTLNAPGTGPGSTGTTNLYTGWSWPAPVESMEWDLVPEIDPVNDGYYWAHEFSWVNGLPGFLGLQAHGGFTLTSPSDKDYKVEFTKMVVFWIGGGESRGAELGDIKDPNARALVVSARGTDWMTIHAKYEWQACNVYHLRIEQDGTAETGDIWYGAWIEDLTNHVQTFLGRISVPVEWGQFSQLSTSITTRIDDKPGPLVVSCSVPEYASAIFGIPTANEGTLLATWPATTMFIDPPRCPTSRFTNLATGVRHEIAVPSSP